MKPRSSSEHDARRRAIPLCGDVERRLIAYALAAGATGATLLAAAKPVHAEIVYTPKFGRLTSGKLLLDLNQDGVPDFELTLHSRVSYRTSGFSQFFFHYEKLALGGNTSASVISSNGSAGVLASGSLIGSSRKFVTVKAQRAQLASALAIIERSQQFFAGGNWKNVQDKYLGLRFKINGETHYGWAKLSVKYRKFIRLPYTVKVEGFAYETVPDQSIQAGQTAEGQVGELTPGNGPQAGSLGALALGAPALDVWRRRTAN